MTLKILRMNNGTEFCNSQLTESIIHQMTAPYTPEQNALIERVNRILIENDRCLLIQ